MWRIFEQISCNSILQYWRIMLYNSLSNNLPERKIIIFYLSRWNIIDGDREKKDMFAYTYWRVAIYKKFSTVQHS